MDWEKEKFWQQREGKTVDRSTIVDAKLNMLVVCNQYVLWFIIRMDYRECEGSISGKANMNRGSEQPKRNGIMSCGAITATISPDLCSLRW